MDCSAWQHGYQLLIAHNDEPDNGLAPNLPGRLAPLQGRAIFLPEEKPLHPDKTALAWHRNKRMG